MNYSVCIDALYPKDEFYKGLQEVSLLGYKTIEFWSWWDKDIDAIIANTKQYDLNISTCCQKFISMCDQTKHEDYLTALKESIVVAKKLGCTKLISQVGNKTDLPYQVQLQNIVDCLNLVNPILEKEKITLLIEPLNTKKDHPGYLLTSSLDAFDIVKIVNSDYVKVLYDIYHQQISEGNILTNIQNNIDLIGHFHVAGISNRAEPYDCELDYKMILNYIDSLGYQGYIGLEYFPTVDQKESLKRILTF